MVRAYADDDIAFVDGGFGVDLGHALATGQNQKPCTNNLPIRASACALMAVDGGVEPQALAGSHRLPIGPGSTACSSTMTSFLVRERDELGDGPSASLLAGERAAELRPPFPGRVSLHFRRVTTLLAVSDHRFTGTMNIDVLVSALRTDQSQLPRR